MWDEICIQRHTQQNRIRTEQKWQRTLEMFRWEKLLLAGENVVALTRIHLIRIIMTATKRQWKAPHLYLSPFAPPLSVSRLASWEYDGSMPNRIHLVHTFPWEIYFVRLLFVRSFFFSPFIHFWRKKKNQLCRTWDDTNYTEQSKSKNEETRETTWHKKRWKTQKYKNSEQIARLFCLICIPINNL